MITLRTDVTNEKLEQGLNPFSEKQQNHAAAIAQETNSEDLIILRKLPNSE
ncbi:MAG: hypothetical protein H6Q13_3601 [Bacteroidetes bacterium]|nr:hypothetical protein [Bacteroidota bacterium]